MKDSNFIRRFCMVEHYGQRTISGLLSAPSQVCIQKMSAEYTQLEPQVKKKNDLLCRYGYFLLMLLCMVVASIHPHLGRTNGIINGNLIIRQYAIPLTYLEAGLVCDPKLLYSTLTNGYLHLFMMIFIYVLMPFSMRVGTCLLTYTHVNTWLLKGMEVLYCMPPPFSTSLVLCRLANADLPTSVIITLVCHFAGLFITPVLLYFVLGASTPPLVGVNVQETMYSTIIPLSVGIGIQYLLEKCHYPFKFTSSWFSRGLLLAMAYHWFCDAVSVDASALQAADVILCVLMACVGQLLISSLCWILCSQWLPRKVLLAALFTSTHKSIGLGSWVLRGAYHGSAQSSAVNLPLSILPVAQLLIGCLLATWLAP